MVKANEESAKLFELDSRGGLNGAHCLWTFACLFDEETKRFYVWLGDITIEKFNKSTYMNLVAFAEKIGASKLVFI